MTITTEIVFDSRRRNIAYGNRNDELFEFFFPWIQSGCGRCSFNSGVAHLHIVPPISCTTSLIKFDVRNYVQINDLENCGWWIHIRRTIFFSFSFVRSFHSRRHISSFSFSFDSCFFAHLIPDHLHNHFLIDSQTYAMAKIKLKIEPHLLLTLFDINNNNQWQEVECIDCWVRIYEMNTL